MAGKQRRSKRKAAAATPPAAVVAPAEHDAEIARLKELLVLMREHGLAELEIGPDGHSVRMSKNGPVIHALPAGSAPVAAPAPAPAALVAITPAAPEKPAGEPFLSPMVGTFYRASSPEAKAFVAEGDSVKPDAVLCIIEAMKVMNEIRAEKAGKIVQILVENGEAVEYGQPLFVFAAAS